MPDREIIEHLITISRRAAALGYVVAGEGNTSARSFERDGFWIKRSGCALGEVFAEDFIKMDIGDALEDLEKAREAVLYKAKDAYRASIEVAMHASIYASQEKANFIIHAHPPCTLAGCCTEDVRGFFVPQFPDSVVYLGVPDRNWVFLEYAPPGPGIAGLLNKALESGFEDLRVVMLANHGAITIGETAIEAMARAEILEKASFVRLMSMMTGRATALAPEDTAYLDGWESEKYRQKVLKGEI